MLLLIANSLSAVDISQNNVVATVSSYFLVFLMQ